MTVSSASQSFTPPVNRPSQEPWSETDRSLPSATGAVRVTTLSIMFVLSGATGLAYQVIWFKRFEHVWGLSTLASAGVVGSFLLGLGLGAWIAGRRVDCLRRPLLWYGVAELFIGVGALLVPGALVVLGNLTAGAPTHLVGGAGAGFLIRLIATFLVIGPICAAMGATLPLLVRETMRGHTTLAGATSWLYAANTLGAAAGAYFTGFHLLPVLGIASTNTTAAVLNMAVGITAVAVARRQPALETVPMRQASVAPGKEDHPDSSRWRRVAVTSAALTGCAAIVLEMIWTRQLALILGGSTYAFTAMLVVVLVGIGLGSLIYRMVFAHRVAGHPVFAVWVIATIIVGAALGKVTIPHASVVVGALKELRVSQGFNGVVCIAASAVLELVPALGMGMLLPHLVTLAGPARRRVGRTVGDVYAGNTFGTVLGAAVSSLLLVPLLGTALAGALALGLGVVAMLMLLVESGNRMGIWPAAAIAVGCLSVALYAQQQDPMLTHRGCFMYGHKAASDPHESTTLLFREGRSCSVLVGQSEDGNVWLRVNGKVDASSTGDMATQCAMAYVPMAVRPDAREAMVIGFGSGTTSGALLQFEHTRVTCAEIEPAVIEASKHFHHVNHRPEHSDRFQVFHDDGRSLLQTRGPAYDLIISEPSNPWMAGTANLFTRQFYEAAHRRLAPGGVLAQWIQVYQIRPQDYAMIVRTAASVFPHQALFRITAGDTMLLLSDQPILPEASTVDAAQRLFDRSSTVTADIKQYFGVSDLRTLLLSMLVADKSNLGQILSLDPDRRVNTDSNLRLEYDAPLALFAPSDTDRINRELVSAGDVPWSLRLFERWQCDWRQAQALQHRANLMGEYGHKAKALAYQRAAFAKGVDPRDPIGLASAKVRAAADEASLRQAAAALASISVFHANQVGVQFWREGEHARAAGVFEELIRQRPGLAGGWANLAVNQEALGLVGEANRNLRRALELDPLSDFAREKSMEYQGKYPRLHWDSSTQASGGSAPAGPTADMLSVDRKQEPLIREVSP